MSVRYFSQDYSVHRNELADRTLKQVQREFGARVEPFTLHLPLPELLAGAWMACRESLLAGSVRRDLKEAVASAVSVINRCPYCVDAHTIMVLASSGKDYSSEILSGRYDAIEDPDVRKAVRWAATTRSPVSPELRSPPFSSDAAPEFIGTAVFFHYINRMATILLGPSPLPFSGGKLKEASIRMAAWFFGRAIRITKEPCVSLDLLPEADLPGDLDWSKPSPCIAGAYAAFSRVVDDAGATVLSGKVKASVLKALDAWDGSDPEPRSARITSGFEKYTGADKAAGNLALSAALFPWRLTERDVTFFSSHYPGDEQLLAVLAWGSFSAARRIGRWIAQA